MNGHTNVFWGWGREDSDMQWRIKNQNMTIAHPEIFNSGILLKFFVKMFQLNHRHIPLDLDKMNKKHVIQWLFMIIRGHFRRNGAMKI